jgi:hypothetical protein
LYSSSSIGWPGTQYAQFLHAITELPSQPCLCLLLILIIILGCFLFSSFIRKSASSFFAAYDALCEEGTATPVCKTLDEIADIAVPGCHLTDFLNQTGSFCHDHVLLANAVSVGNRHLFNFVIGSKDHVKVQGEILEGLVARIVPRQSLVQMEEVLKNFPQAPFDAGKVMELKLYALLSLFNQYKSFFYIFTICW